MKDKGQIQTTEIIPNPCRISSVFVAEGSSRVRLHIVDVDKILGHKGIETG